MSQQGPEIILGVGGGIAAYKSCDLLRRLQDRGYQVNVVPTPASLNFVGKATWEALSGRPVSAQVWENVHTVPHISLADKSEFFVIAPATADLIARLAAGRADDLLTNYNESLKKNKDDPNRYIALLEIALETDTYKKKLQSENELREKTHINNLDSIALSSLASKTPLDSTLEDNLHQELSEKANLKDNHQKLLIKKQKGNASYKEILIQNIKSLESSYKNDDLENNVDDMLNFAFSAITSLASSLLCCYETKPQTKIIQTSSSYMFKDNKVRVV